MVTLGDVFLIFAGLLGVSLAAWAAMVLSCMLFPARCATGAQELEYHPVRAFFIGLSILLPVGGVGMFLIALPAPVAKFLGLVVWLILLAFAAFGSGGLARLVGQRVQTTGGASTFYGGYVRGASLVVLACHIPLVGWFLFAPLLLVCSLGMATRSLFGNAGAQQWPQTQSETQ